MDGTRGTVYLSILLLDSYQVFCLSKPSGSLKTLLETTMCQSKHNHVQ